MRTFQLFLILLWNLAAAALGLCAGPYDGGGRPYVENDLEIQRDVACYRVMRNVQSYGWSAPLIQAYCSSRCDFSPVVVCGVKEVEAVDDDPISSADGVLIGAELPDDVALSLIVAVSNHRELLISLAVVGTLYSVIVAVGFRDIGKDASRPIVSRAGLSGLLVAGVCFVYFCPGLESVFCFLFLLCCGAPTTLDMHDAVIALRRLRDEEAVARVIATVGPFILFALFLVGLASGTSACGFLFTTLFIALMALTLYMTAYDRASANAKGFLFMSFLVFFWLFIRCNAVLYNVFGHDNWFFSHLTTFFANASTGIHDSELATLGKGARGSVVIAMMHLSARFGAILRHWGVMDDSGGSQFALVVAAIFLRLTFRAMLGTFRFGKPFPSDFKMALTGLVVVHSDVFALFRAPVTFIQLAFTTSGSLATFAYDCAVLVLTVQDIVSGYELALLRLFITTCVSFFLQESYLSRVAECYALGVKLVGIVDEKMLRVIPKPNMQIIAAVRATFCKVLVQASGKTIDEGTMLKWEDESGRQLCAVATNLTSDYGDAFIVAGSEMTKFALDSNFYGGSFIESPFGSVKYWSLESRHQCPTALLPNAVHTDIPSFVAAVHIKAASVDMHVRFGFDTKMKVMTGDFDFRPADVGTPIMGVTAGGEYKLIALVVSGPMEIGGYRAVLTFDPKGSRRSGPVHTRQDLPIPRGGRKQFTIRFKDELSMDALIDARSGVQSSAVGVIRQERLYTVIEQAVVTVNQFHQVVKLKRRERIFESSATASERDAAFRKLDSLSSDVRGAAADAVRFCRDALANARHVGLLSYLLSTSEYVVQLSVDSGWDEDSEQESLYTSDRVSESSVGRGKAKATAIPRLPDVKYVPAKATGSKVDVQEVNRSIPMVKSHTMRLDAAFHAGDTPRRAREAREALPLRRVVSGPSKMAWQRGNPYSVLSVESGEDTGDD